jgi:hypothetical protein
MKLRNVVIFFFLMVACVAGPALINWTLLVKAETRCVWQAQTHQSQSAIYDPKTGRFARYVNETLQLLQSLTPEQAATAKIVPSFSGLGESLYVDGYTTFICVP